MHAHIGIKDLYKMVEKHNTGISLYFFLHNFWLLKDISSFPWFTVIWKKKNKNLPGSQSPKWTTWKRKELPTVEILVTLSQPPGRQWMQAQHLMFNARKSLLNYSCNNLGNGNGMNTVQVRWWWLDSTDVVFGGSDTTLLQYSMRTPFFVINTVLK